MIKRMAITVFGLLLLIGALAGMKAMQIMDLVAAGEAMSIPPTAVTATSVEEADWEQTLSSIGTLEAAQGVTITADFQGRVTRLYFDGGEKVSRGTLLLEQETSAESAQLDAAESELELAQQNLDRVSRLFRSRVVSRAEFDTARVQAQAAQAQVDNITATLDKKQILAPFDGRLGLRLVDIGQDLAQGVPIVSLQSIEPMRVNFSLPQSALREVGNGLPVRVRSDVVPDAVFEGEITAIDTEVDDLTRTVRLQATLDSGAPNADKLLPGMYASVEVVLPDARPVLMIPQTAVSFATFGDSVFVLEAAEDAQADATTTNDTLIARQQFVQLGERRGDFVEVLAGVDAGQRLANDGVFKLRNGASVAISEESSTPALNPAPGNG